MDEMDCMTEEEGALFLLRRTHLLSLQASLDDASPENRQTAKMLSQAADGLPLALDLAGAYILATGCTLADYLALYVKRRAELLQLRRVDSADHPNSVAPTFALAFERVAQEQAAAQELLSFLAFLAPDRIPEELVLEYGNLLGPLLQPLSTDQLAFENTLQALQKFFLIHRNTQMKVLSIHRLIQAVLQDTMSIDVKHLWIQRAIQTVATAFSGEESMKWSVKERYLPHALQCVTWIKKEPMAFPDATYLLFKTGDFLKERTQYREAEALFLLALEICEQASAADLPFAAACLDGLAQIYKKQEKYKQAEPLYKRALTIYQQQTGNDHLMATTFNNLAALYESQGKYKQAEQFYLRTLTIRQQVMGDEQIPTAMIRKNLADLYVSQGRYTEAEPLLQRALVASEQILGSDDPLTNIVLGSLAKLYKNQKKYAEAETLYQRSLDRSTQSLGPEHPHVVLILNNLAILYAEQGKDKQAEQLYLRALTIDEKIWGPEHTELVADLNNLAALYLEQKKYAEAEPLFYRALQIAQQRLGVEHPKTINVLRNLHALYESIGKDANRDCLKTAHPDTLLRVHQFAYFFYEKEGKYAEAEPLYQCTLAAWRRQLGEDHPTTASGLNNLAQLYAWQGKYEQAEPLFRRALEIFRQRFGPRHPDTQAIQRSYTRLLQKLGRDS